MDKINQPRNEEKTPTRIGEKGNPIARGTFRALEIQQSVRETKGFTLHVSFETHELLIAPGIAHAILLTRYGVHGESCCNSLPSSNAEYIRTQMGAWHTEAVFPIDCVKRRDASASGFNVRDFGRGAAQLFSKLGLGQFVKLAVFLNWAHFQTIQ